MKALLSALMLLASVLSNSHDITTLSKWGPYSKKYDGISHVADVDSGRRVDFTLVPGIYRRNLLVPNALFESSCYPWEVSPDMSRITYRYELEWKDRLYIDASYNVLDDRHVLLEMHCVNATPLTQNITLQTAACMQYAEDYPRHAVQGASQVLAAVDYDSYEPAVHGHDYALVYNGWMRGEKSDPQSVSGTVLETSGAAGDELVMGIAAQNVWMRCRSCQESAVDVDVNGMRLAIGSQDYGLVRVPVLDGKVVLRTLGEGRIRVDALIEGDEVQIVSSPLSYVPQITRSEGSYIVKYDTQDEYYGVAWNYPYSEVRAFANSDLDVFMRRAVHDHVHDMFVGDEGGHFTASFLRPVVLQAQSDTTLYSLIVSGDKAYVEEQTALFNADERPFTSQIRPYRSGSGLLPGADRYSLVGQLIQATVLTDVVYPVYTQRQYIRHFTPGKNWNSLYTWDLGFIGWAMSEIDPVKSYEIIRAYTTEQESQSAFIHHGTPLPIQFFAFESLYAKTGDDEGMAYMYPRLKRFYDFMMGHDPDSRTMMDSGLMRTWDYFYNSGGWDDYPPQKYLVDHPEGYPHVTPVVSSAYYLRAAKILRLMAQRLGLKADVKQYDRDIERTSSAVQTHCWDPECGYFSYVSHDAEGRPEGFLRYADGTNFNMGLDGVSPLVAGICTREQQQTLLSHIFTPGELWSDVGVSTVDQRAPYFRIDGYWNGCVWMPHQLVLWKTMLDLGRTDLAEKIAYTALDRWKAETEESYQCYEHFMISTKRGGGWHNFSGLSSAVVNWFYSYFKLGTVSTGFNILICDPQMNEACDSYSARLMFDKDAKGSTGSIMLCLDPAHSYAATLDGKALVTESPRPGLVYVQVPVGGKAQQLKVSAVE